MKRWHLISAALIFALIGIISCARKSGDLKTFPLNSLDGIIAKENVIFDKDISADGKGSICVESPSPVTIPLFNLNDIKVDDTRLVYAAKVRTQRLFGQVFLEMLTYFPNRGEVISQGQETLISGNSDWKDSKTLLDIPKGEKPDSVKLNIVINGRGTAWIDDIRLSREPLPKEQP